MDFFLMNIRLQYRPIRRGLTSFAFSISQIPEWIISTGSVRKMLPVIFLMHITGFSLAQTSSDSSGIPEDEAAADDPSRYFTRVELFNELQRHHNNYYLNATTLRTIVKLGEKFTTRLDIPFLYNSTNSPAGYQQFGISDISFRLLGFKFVESPKRAFTASIEFSLNTANSPLTGTGKNIIAPMFSFSQSIKKGVLLAFVFEQAVSFSGDKNRQDINYSKMQAILLYTWSKKIWTTLAPEWYIDYVGGGSSLNMEGRIAYAVRPRLNLFAQAGAGIFGNPDFIPYYAWSAEIGIRYFMFRTRLLKKG
jgi:hypothetical protein